MWNISLKHYNNSKVFIEWLNDIVDINKKVYGFNPNKKCKVFIVFYDMIVDSNIQ